MNVIAGSKPMLESKPATDQDTQQEVCVRENAVSSAEIHSMLDNIHVKEESKCQ